MKVGITGGTGLVGSAFSRHCDKKFEWEIIPGPSLGGPNFKDRKETIEFFGDNNFDAIVHTAATVGGIKANIDNPLKFYSENIQINTNVLDAVSKVGIKKCISFLSTCIYPDQTEYPLVEENIHAGAPHDSNMFYAHAKRMLDIHSQAIKKDKKLNYFCVVPNNLYGINDNFELNNSHVIPGIILKVTNAIQKKKKTLTLWGDGTPRREFTFSEDIPAIISFLLRKRKIDNVINIGNNNREYSIKEVANDIIALLEADLKIKWDTKKPTGQLRKPSSTQKLKDLGYDTSSLTDLRLGLKKTISWFNENYPNVRGLG